MATSVIGAVGMLLVVAGVLYVVVVRPRIHQWGATDQEHRASWPGDQLVVRPRYVWTNAITIHAPAAQVWPWLVQLHDHLVQIPHRMVDLGPQGRVVGEHGGLQLQPDRKQRLHDLVEQPTGDPLALGDQRQPALLLLVGVKHAAYLLIVRANQPTLQRQLATLPWPDIPVADETRDRGHGRVEIRRLQATTVAGLDFPHVTQAIRITRRVRPLAGQK